MAGSLLFRVPNSRSARRRGETNRNWEKRCPFGQSTAARSLTPSEPFLSSDSSGGARLLFSPPQVRAGSNPAHGMCFWMRVSVGVQCGLARDTAQSHSRARLFSDVFLFSFFPFFYPLPSPSSSKLPTQPPPPQANPPTAPTPSPATTTPFSTHPRPPFIFRRAVRRGPYVYPP